MCPELRCPLSGCCPGNLSEHGTGHQAGAVFFSSVGWTARNPILALASLGLIPADAAAHLSTASRWCLVIAMAGIGINTSLGEIRELGYRPAAILVDTTVFIAALGLTGALLLFTPAR